MEIDLAHALGKSLSMARKEGRFTGASPGTGQMVGL